jgi:ferric-dicitrate binding protein FerR (iron transport regulator)
MGTEFNIRAWYESSFVAVTVKEGKVALSFNDRSVSPMVYVTDGKQSLFPKHGYPSNPVSVNIDDYTSWKHNELHFHDASLTEIIAQLERWYDYQFEVDDALLYKNHLTFHIKRTNVDNLLESISIITKTDVVREGNKIMLVKKQNN